MYTSELARHQDRVILFRYNLNLSRVFGVVNTPIYNHAKPSNNVWSPLTIGIQKRPIGSFFNSYVWLGCDEKLRWVRPMPGFRRKQRRIVYAPPRALFDYKGFGKILVSDEVTYYYDDKVTCFNGCKIEKLKNLSNAIDY